MQNNKNKNLKFFKNQKKCPNEPSSQKGLPRGIFRIERRDDIRLLYKINNVIIERNLLQPNQRILIAVSGGQDSICLLRVLFELKKKWNWKLGILHCDHRWTSSSKFQAEHVACLAFNLQINYHQGITIESVQKEGIARIWRYNIIKTVAISNKYTAVITGHNASDRIETLLYNLTRGSGLHGLQSIRWKRYLCSSILIQSPISRKKLSFLFNRLKYKKRIPSPTEAGRQLPPASRGEGKAGRRLLCWTSGKGFSFFHSPNGDLRQTNQLFLIRPLLETTRTEIRNVLNLWHFPSWPDRSNKELRISRNRIRHRLIPYIRLHYNLKIDQTLARWAEIVQSETFYIEQLTNYILSKIEIKKKISSLRFKGQKRLFDQNSPYKAGRRSPTEAEGEDLRLNFYQSAISIDLLRSLPLAIQRRVVKQYIYRITGRILGFQYIEQIRLSCLFHSSLSSNFPIRSLDLQLESINPLYAPLEAGRRPLCWTSGEKKNKVINPWIIFPSGIKLLVRKNYIFFFSPMFFPFQDF